MKKKDLNQVKKKKKQINPPKEKLNEKLKEKKTNPILVSSEKQNPHPSSSNIPKEKKPNNLTELPQPGLTRKKSEQKYKVDNRLFEEKNLKKEYKPRVFSHSPERPLNPNNVKVNINKTKNTQQKNLTDRKFNPSTKTDNMKSPNNIKIPKQNLIKNESSAKKEEKKMRKIKKMKISQKKLIH